MITKLNIIPWASAWEIGIREIDDDHRLLVSESNDLFEALAKSRPKAEIILITGRMTHHCLEHFQREEKILRGAKYKEVNEHAAEHRRIEREIEKVIRDMQGADVSVAEWKAFALYFQSTLINHLVRYDMKFKSHLLWVQGLTCSPEMPPV